MLSRIILFLYLLLMSVYDIKKREIQIEISGIVAVVLAARQLYFVLQGDVSWLSAFAGVAVGVLIVVVSGITRGQIGIGDGIVFMISGMSLSFYENGVLLFLSLVVGSVSGVFLILSRHGGRKTILPFVPCVFIGYGVMCLWKNFGQ